MLVSDSNRLGGTNSGGTAPGKQLIYCGSKRDIAIANRKPVATIAATAPAVILAISRLV
ncbi:hypothetical protein ACVIQY_006667 [Bradyrhizobium sp. USDA 3051]